MKKHIPNFLAGIIMIAALPPGLLADINPEDGENKVNAYTTNRQFLAHIAPKANGEFMVVWSSSGQDGDGYGAFLRHLDFEGVPFGSEFQVNSDSTGVQFGYQPITFSDGHALVPFSSDDGDGYDTFLREIDSTGSPIGLDFQINTTTTGDQYAPQLIKQPGESFLVVWADDDAGLHINGRLYSANTIPLTAEFQISAASVTPSPFPKAATQSNGGFVVVWRDGIGSPDYEIKGRILDSLGNTVGGDFTVNANTTGVQELPDIAASEDGFMVIWKDGSDISGRALDSSGSPIGADFVVRTHTTNVHTFPRLQQRNGRFVVAWTQGVGQALDPFVQEFEADGTPLGTALQVNTYTTGLQWSQQLAMQSSGRFVVAWTDYEQDAISGIFSRSFSQSPLFADGFESGDTSAWSAAQP